MTLLQSAANFMPLILGVAFGSLLLIMWRRNMASELPFFFRYVALYALGLIVLFILCQTEPPLSQYHYYIYWLFSFATTIMTFFVLYEVFVRLLKPNGGVCDKRKPAGQVHSGHEHAGPQSACDGMWPAHAARAV